MNPQCLQAVNVVVYKGVSDASSVGSGGRHFIGMDPPPVES